MRSWLRPNFLLSLALIVPVAACSSDSDARGGSDSSAPIDFSALRDFTSISATGPDDVVVTVGGAFKVGAEGDAKAIQALDIRVVNGELRIGRKREGGWFGRNEEGKGVTIRVSMPAIARADLTGSGDLSIDRAQGKALSLGLTGSGDMKVGTASISDLTARVTGSGGIAIAGTAEHIDVSATGSGDLDGEGLKAGGGKVSVLGSGNVAFASDGSVDISIMGSGDVDVKGSAQCKTSVMGSGEAHCGA